MNDATQIDRATRYYEDRAVLLLERILCRRRWTANDRDRIAKFLEQTAIKAPAYRSTLPASDDE